MAKSILLYGVTGSFKTSQIPFLARYIYEKYHKITRVIYTGASDGGLTAPEEKAGLIESFRLGLRDAPASVIRRLAKGNWPRVVEDKGVLKLQLVEPNAETWKRVGAIVLDSLGMGADEVMRDAVDRGRPMAQEVVTPFTEKIEIVSAQGQVSSFEEKFAAPAKAHYGFGQNYAVGIINAMSSLPVEIVMFTTMEKKVEEEDSSGRNTIYGPDLPGNKLTPKVGGLVGDLIHMDQYFVSTAVPDIDPATNRQRMITDPVSKRTTPVTTTVLLPKTRAYFVKHPDSKTGITFPAKPRLPSVKWPDLLKKWPLGYFEPQIDKGLDEYLKVIDELEAGATDGAREWRERIDQAMKGAVSTK